MTMRDFIELGYDWLRYNHTKEAEILFRAILLVDDKNYQAMNGLSSVFDKQGEIEAALQMINCALEIKQDAVLWNNKGLLLQKKENHKKAIFCFDKAISLDNDSMFYINKARSLEKLGIDNKNEIKMAEDNI